VRRIVEKCGSAFAPGDVFIMNDPYAGGTHTADVALVRPLFAGGRHLGFAIATAHWTEIGGAVAGSLPPDATEIYQEGLRLPGLRLCRDDEISQDVLDLIAANVRLPRNCLGDLQAELAAVRIADTRIRETAERYGAETLEAAFRAILDHAESVARDEVRALPDGIYTARDIIDGDGNQDDPIPVEVTIAVEGDTMRFDFTGCASQRRAPINCTRGALLSAVKTVFKAMIAPEDPSNDGWFRPLEVVVPDGTVFSAVPPAPTGWYYEGSAQASELVWKALAPLKPERFSAGSYMSLCATYICADGGGENDDVFVHIEPAHGGWGATPERDGASGLIAVTDGDTYNYSVELLETKLPVRLRRYALNTGDGSGAGRWRGGFGCVREYEILVDGAFAYGSLGRSSVAPWGQDGGESGTCNYLELVRDGERQRFSRTPRIALKRGDLLRVVTGGGGGVGDPRQRPAEAVRADLADDYIGADEAYRVYGLELSAPC
jgi:N-methylhydantoinase B